jgi:hypothetical protein
MNLPPNPFDVGSQNWRIYRRLALYGRVTNRDIRYGLGGPEIYNTTGRCSDIRAFLKPHGIALHCERVRGSLFEYSV